jgi:small GTP-binding protein
VTGVQTCALPISEGTREFPNFSTYNSLKKQYLEKARKLECHQKQATKHPAQEIKKQGDGKIVLLGVPNAGKSSLMSRLTNASPEIASYAFTTKKPYSGMLNYSGANIQLMEIPGLFEGASAGYGRGRSFLSIAKNADAILLVIDLSSDPLRQYGILKKELSESGIEKKTMVVGTKTDVSQLRPCFAEAAVFVNQGSDMLELKEMLFSALEKIRVYTKKPKEEPDLEKPFIMKKRATARELLGKFSEEFQKQVKSARVWGSAKFPGQKVSLGYELCDKDIIEFD